MRRASHASSPSKGCAVSALRDGRWKVIVDADAGGTEVYDLATDSGEHHPLRGDRARADVAQHYQLCLGL